MFFTLISRLLGIIKARVITTAFGATMVADVINVAYYLPNNLRKIFAEGAMNTAFIPGLSACEQKQGKEKLLSLMLMFQLILFSILVVIFIFFGKPLFSFISDFNEEGTALGGTLLPYFIGFLAFISLSNALLSILQIEEKFTSYGLAPLFFSVTVISLVYFFSDKIGAYSMAWGTLIGSALQCLFSYVCVVKIKYKVRLSLCFKDARFKKIIKAWILIILSSIATLLSQQYSAYLASTMHTGSATAYASSMIFFSTPYGIIFTGIAIVAFPQLSTFYTISDDKSYSKVLHFAIEGMIYLFVPATISLMFLNKEAVAVVLQNGKFTFEDTLLTASVLFYLLIGLLIVGLNGLFARALIAREKTRLSVRITSMQALIDIVCSYTLVSNGLGVISLPIANNISAIIALTINFILLRKYINFKLFLASLLKAGVAALPMIIFLIIYKLNFSTWYSTGSTLHNFLYFIVLGLICIVLTFSMYFFMKVPILSFIKKRD